MLYCMALAYLCFNNPFCCSVSFWIYNPFAESKKQSRIPIVAGVSTSILCLIFLIIGVITWRRCHRDTYIRKRSDLTGLELLAGSFTLRQLRLATGDFSSENKIGEGGFGSVYKGQLSDGTVIAVKQLSSKSRQGNREFVTEIGMISGLQHPNLVKLYGCCIEGDQLLLAFVLQRKGELSEIMDPNLENKFNKEEAETVLKVALLCTNASSVLRPTMSEVVSMLEGQTQIQEVVSDPGIYGDDLANDLRFKPLKAYYQQLQNKSATETKDSNSLNTKFTEPSTSTSAQDLYKNNPESLTISAHDLYENNPECFDTSDFSSLVSRRSSST
ncbi:Tyrosine-protein kinase [Parasponia andersonii]|uniref:Tyrosine-protein kinase n=1 Tax=Parasponia andersonii TaxID=3476 RepID=A0A2P5B222_PARAD|nr:Tyrosine-protein kinase [Parasponia andersonii]